MSIKKSDLIIATTVRQRDFNIPQIKIKDIEDILNGKMELRTFVLIFNIHSYLHF